MRLRAQTTSRVLMVRPANFGYNPETAETNAFMEKAACGDEYSIKEKAVMEFDGFVSKLLNAGVDVTVIPDTEAPVKPDAVFPNNWLTTHSDGTIVTYPMAVPSRSSERRPDIIDTLHHLFQITNQIRYEHHEKEDKFLEGTGAMVLDRVNKIVYCCTGCRANSELLDLWAKEMGFEVVAFKSEDETGTSLYHTNVMMALGDTFAIICLDAISDKDQKNWVVDKLASTGHRIIPISMAQMNHMAGNMLQVDGRSSQRILVMSEQAYLCLESQQKDIILEHVDRILYSPLYIIERYAGGSARCMMCELFLPRHGESFFSDQDNTDQRSAVPLMAASSLY